MTTWCTNLVGTGARSQFLNSPPSRALTWKHPFAVFISTKCRHDHCNEAPWCDDGDLCQKQRDSLRQRWVHLCHACVSAALRGRTGQQNCQRGRLRRSGALEGAGCLGGRGTQMNSRLWSGSRLGDGWLRLGLHRTFLFRWVGLRLFERWIPRRVQHTQTTQDEHAVSPLSCKQGMIENSTCCHLKCYGASKNGF